MRCVLLSGGGGTRLWPLSTKECPKQYLRIPGGQTIFENTLSRNQDLFDEFQVITNYRYEDLSTEGIEAQGLADTAQLVLEPCPRNTAPAVAVAALLARANDIVLVAPTDHYIQGRGEYAAAIERAECLARDGSLVVFGIEPTRPHAGYGYIRHEGDQVLAFKEKPDLATAKRYLAEGGYLWNSGMLAFRAQVMLDEMRRWCPDILEACEQVVEASEVRDGAVRLDKDLFAQVRADSIDYAVIERSQCVRVVPARFEWNDLGSLASFGELADADERENRAMGEDVVLHDCAGTSVYNASGKTVVLNGTSDLIVAVTDGAVYVTRRESADEIRELGEWKRRRSE